jgi:hypothetical protein
VLHSCPFENFKDNFFGEKMFQNQICVGQEFFRNMNRILRSEEDGIGVITEIYYHDNLSGFISQRRSEAIFWV